MEKVINWLLGGPAWIRSRCLTELLNVPDTDHRVVEAHSVLIHDPQINLLLSDVNKWESALLKRHNDADHPIHKLCFLADIGLSIENQDIQEITSMILDHHDSSGPFLSLSNYPIHFGGTGKDEWLWALCDAPLLTYALSKLGLHAEPRIKRSLNFLVTLARENGWPCAVSASLGNFRGPGKKSDPCPYATLVMLKALSTQDSEEYRSVIQNGINSLLYLWEKSQTEHPYLFKMGTDFRKLKAPFIWFDILHTAEVLSHFHYARSDNRFLSMLDVLRSKMDLEGYLSSESIWTKWKGWEFCQKAEPSRWITLSVYCILKRVGFL